jgi:hypothetical protein
MGRQSGAMIAQASIDLSLRQASCEAQVSAAQIGPVELRPRKIGVIEPGAAQVGPLQPRVSEVCFRERGAHQVRLDQRCLVQPRPAQLCPTEIDRTALDATELALGCRHVEIIQDRNDAGILESPGIPRPSSGAQHLDMPRG